MKSDRVRHWNRREFVRGVTLAGTASLLGVASRSVAAEPPPETTRLRLVNMTGICIAPQYVAETLLEGEGFTDVHYVRTSSGLATARALANGDADVTLNFVGPFIIRVDQGDPIVMLAGVHAGCFELFGTDRVKAIRDLKGKAVAVRELGSAHHVFVAAMASHGGIDPKRAIRFVIRPRAQSMHRLADGKIDALIAAPPAGQ